MQYDKNHSKLVAITCAIISSKYWDQEPIGIKNFENSSSNLSVEYQEFEKKVLGKLNFIINRD